MYRIVSRRTLEIRMACSVLRAYSAKGEIVEEKRPNHNMTHLAYAAIVIAANQSRLAAVEFLFDRGCAPEMIAHVLAAFTPAQCFEEDHAP